MRCIVIIIRLKKINTMSQSSWQIGRPDLNAVFFNGLFFFPEQQTCQIWVGYSFEIWNLIFGWTRYKTEHRVEEVCCSKCFIVSVISFLVYFNNLVHKKMEKKINKQKKKIKPWILLNQTHTEKRTRAAALRHRIYFFLALLSFWPILISRFLHSIDHFRITAIWPGDRIRRPEHPTENEVRRCSCDESV